MPATDLAKAEHRAAQQQAAAADQPWAGTFPVEHWRWALSVRHLPVICHLNEVQVMAMRPLEAKLRCIALPVNKACLGRLSH